MLDTIIRLPKAVAPYTSTSHGRPANPVHIGPASTQDIGGANADIVDFFRGHVVKDRLASLSRTEATLAYPQYRDFNQRLATFEARTHNHEDVRAVALAGFFLVENTVKCYACGWSAPSSPLPTGITTDHLRKRPNCTRAQSEQLRKQMQTSPSERRKTFKGRWTQRVPNADQLARSGFYLGPQEDAIPECAFCRVQISAWPPDEHPLDIHGRFSPFCSFVLNPPSYAGYDVCGTSGYGCAVPGAERHSSPKHPNMVSPDARLKTFDSWEGPVSKEALVVAGLFALGHHDDTMCYHCGVGLQQWVEGDDPWEEHARTSPNCELVRLRRRGRVPLEKVSGEGVPRANVPAEPTPVAQAPVTFSISPRVDLVRPGHQTSASARAPSVTRCGIGSQELRLPRPSIPELPACVVCRTAPREVLFLPCSHLVTCGSCAAAMSQCLLCRGNIHQVFRLQL